MANCRIDVDAQVQRLVVKRRQSMRALLVLTTMLLCAAALYAAVPGWGSAIVVGVLGFPWVGDVINVAWITWRLRRLSTQIDSQ
jgi:hypothetical protein